VLHAFVGRFTERIQTLAANQGLLVKNEWQGVDVEDLVRAQLAHFADLLGTPNTRWGASKYQGSRDNLVQHSKCITSSTDRGRTTCREFPVTNGGLRDSGLYLPVRTALPNP
jgi:hypothetical protein